MAKVDHVNERNRGDNQAAILRHHGGLFQAVKHDQVSDSAEHRGVREHRETTFVFHNIYNN
jgi:hypothetical protein